MIKKSNQIYITCSVDSNQNFQEITAVMLYSLIKNLNPKKSAYVYILHDPKDISTLKMYCKYIQDSFNNIKFEWIEVDDSIFKDRKVQSYNNLPMWTYYRLLLPELLDQDKVIYLDWDILVDKDISWLWDINLEDNLLAWVKTNVLKRWMENIQVDNYINAGMMLVNLKSRKEQNIWHKCIDFCVKYPMWIMGKVKIMWDQCAINKVCEDKIKYIDPIYNQTPMCFRWDLKYDQLWYSKVKYTKAIKDPTIIHFAGVDKPWKLSSLHPYNILWDRYHHGLTSKSNIYRYLVHNITSFWNLNTPIYHLYTTVKKNIKKLVQNNIGSIYK